MHKQKNKKATFWSKYKTHIAAVIPTVPNRNFASSQAAELCAFRRVSSLAYDFIEGRKITVHDFIGTIFLEPGDYPLLLLTGEYPDCRFASAGYSVGSVELIAKLAALLRKTHT